MSKPVQVPSARRSGIELARIVAILGVLILHYNGNHAFNAVSAGSFNHYLLSAFEVSFIWAVDLFVLISGYFLISSNQRRAVKALELIVLVILSRLPGFVMPLLSNGIFSLKALGIALVPDVYYTTLYITLYLLSPYLNLALCQLSRQQYRRLIVLCLVLFSLLPTVLDTLHDLTDLSFWGLYPTNTSGSQNGYSIVNFTLMYILGGYLRRFGQEKLTARQTGCNILLFILCTGLLFAWQLVDAQVSRAYCNPLVIAQALLLFRLFAGLSLQSRFVNIMAKSVFTCFLFHGLFQSKLQIERFTTGNPLVLLAHLTVSTLLIYLICWVGWWVYDKLTAPVFRWIGQKTTRLDQALSIHAPTK